MHDAGERDPLTSPAKLAFGFVCSKHLLSALGSLSPRSDAAMRIARAVVSSARCALRPARCALRPEKPLQELNNSS
jgi:hypothetical protein